MDDKVDNTSYTGETNIKGQKHGYGVMKSSYQTKQGGSWTSEGYWFNGQCGLEIYLQNDTKDTIVQEFKVAKGGT